MITLNNMTIPAEVHTDCRTEEAKFDALAWFQQAEDEDILQLADCDWGGDYPADEVAEYFQDRRKSPEVQQVFDTLHTLRKSGKDIGFECHVEEEPALTWLKENRPWLHSMITNAGNENEDVTAYVCTYTVEEILCVKTQRGNQTIEELLREHAEDEAVQAGFDWPEKEINIHVSKVGTPKVHVEILKASTSPH